MTPETMNQIAEEILTGCTLESGKLVLGDPLFLSIGGRIRESDDKKGWGTALIALATRLRGVPGAGQAAERVTALAAVALGDAELNALVQRELGRK
jgi:hypothetical protein